MLTKAMVIDDEESIVELLKEVLASHNLATVGFSEPKKALAALEREKFGVIICDLHMPEMDGFEFCAAVREKLPHIPLIALTGTNDKGKSLLSKNDGKKRAQPNVILTKPFHYQVFYQSLSDLAESIEF